MDHTQADMFDMNAKKEDDSTADSALKGLETDTVLAQKGLTDGDLEGKLQEPILDDDLTKQSDIERNNRPSKHARTATDRSDTPRRLEETIMGAERCDFLELPKELRLQIYNYLISPDCMQLATHIHQVRKGQNWCHQVLKHGSTRAHLHPSILHTCREIYDEATSILYRPRHLELYTSVGYWATFADMRPFPTIHLRNVRVLQSLSVYSRVSERRAAQDLAYSALFIKILRTVVKVQDLVICLQAGWVHGVRLSRSFRRTLTDVLEMWLGAGLGANICVSSDGILSQVLWRRLCGQQWHQEESGPETSAETKYHWAWLFDIIKAASAPPTSRDPTRWQVES